jgi:transglutaminase-like putative cysteine protease
MTALNREITFDTDPTHAATTAAQAFTLRRGVCQDITHIFIAAARALGIPARYVGGHFHRADGVTSQEAGHAWAEAHVENLGWVGFDPTNGISTTESHVRVAVGLDYLGAAPVRGARFGGSGETLTVAVRVDQARQQAQT